MKRAQVLLFLVCCVLLFVGDVFAGSLIALGLLFQLNILFEKIPLTKKSQLAALKLFLFSTPLFFFLGAIHSFVSLYFRESQWVFLLFALIITYSLFFLVNLCCFSVYAYLVESHFNISLAYQSSFMNIKNAKKGLFKQTFFLLVLSLIPILTSDWKIVFALTVFQLFRHRLQLKPVFGL